MTQVLGFIYGGLTVVGIILLVAVICAVKANGARDRAWDRKHWEDYEQ